MPSITNIYRNFVQGIREDQNQSDRIAKLEKWIDYLEGLIASSSLWARDAGNGWLYPVTLTDSVSIGDSVQPISSRLYIRANQLVDNNRNGLTIYKDYIGDGIYVQQQQAGQIALHAKTTSSAIIARFDNNLNRPALYAQNDNSLVAIGHTAPTAQLHIQSYGNTSATFAQKIENSSSIPLLSVRDDGYTYIGSYGRLWSNEAQGYAVFYPATSSNGTLFYGNAGAAIVAGASTPFYFGSSGSVGPNDGVTAISNTFYAVPHGVTYTFGRLTTQNNNTNAVLGDIILRGHTSRDISTLNTIGGKVRIVGGNGAALFAGNASGGDVEIDGGTGYGTGTKGLVKIQGLTYPSVDGSADYVLKTDGAGNLLFASSGSLAGKKYVAPITGLSGTILGATHLQGTDVVVQIYEAGALQTATITVNGSGDVSWSVGVALVSGKIIIV